MTTGLQELATEAPALASQLQGAGSDQLGNELSAPHLPRHETLKRILEHHVSHAGSAPEALRRAARALAGRGLEWHSVACRFTADRLERAGVSDVEDGALPALLDSYARVHDCMDERRVAASLREIAAALLNTRMH